jgi:hypothetical protein
VSLCVAVSTDVTVVTSTDPAGGAKAWRETDLSGTEAGSLASVSCPSVSLCVAVDQDGNVVSSTRPTRSAHAWKVTDVDRANVTGNSSTGLQVGFESVSCASRSLCVAGDGAGTVVVSRHPAGGARYWKHTQIGGGQGSASFLGIDGISCLSAGLCFAGDTNGNVVIGGGRGSLPALPRKPAHPCDAHRPGANLATGQAIVYGIRSPSVTTYFACQRPNGDGDELGQDTPSNAEYGSDETTGGFVAAGAYVAAQSTSGFAAAEMCTKYQESGCPQGNSWIAVVDVNSHRSVNVSTANYESSVTVSPSGAIAWLQPARNGGLTLLATALHPDGPGALAGSPKQLDSGRIDPTSLTFTGPALHWTKNGQSHAQTLA